MQNTSLKNSDMLTKYHNSKGGLIFRYDNAAHKPPLGVKEHKHLPDGKIIPSPPPDIHNLLEEAVGHFGFAGSGWNHRRP